MAKSKQPSAARRREQVRQERLQRLDTAQKVQSRNKNVRKQQKKNNPWILIGSIVVLVIVVIGIFLYLSSQQSTTAQKGNNQALKAITTINPSLLAAVGPGSAQNTMHGAGGPLLKGPTGKPEFFYMGGEYCPFCAAQRWAMIIALSRFGTFKSITPIVSAESSIPTFTFHGSTYTSQYIDFVARETASNQQPPQPLESATPAEQQLAGKYDAPPYVPQQQAGSIPFIDIANQQVSAGSYYVPDLLASHSYDDIVTQIKDPNSDIARGMLGAANFLTAAICQATNDKPANVCTAEPIPAIEQKLPTPSSSLVFGAGEPQLGTSANLYDMIVRRQD